MDQESQEMQEVQIAPPQPAAELVEPPTTKKVI